MSINDRGKDLAINPDGLRTQSRHQKEWHGCRAALGVSGQGQYYDFYNDFQFFNFF
jgi:ATP-dependent RNA helicase DDX1